MASEFPHEPQLHQVEKELAAYAPRPPRIDRDRLMFEAGRAAAATMAPVSHSAVVLPVSALPYSPLRLPSWLWPSSTAVMTIVATGLGVALLVRSSPLEPVQVVDRYVPSSISEPHPAPAPATAVTSGRVPWQDSQLPAETDPVLTIESLPEHHLLRVRQVALTQGVDALPPSAGREASRLLPPPSRASLMRAMAMPRNNPAAIPTQIHWPNWLKSSAAR